MVVLLVVLPEARAAKVKSLVCPPTVRNPAPGL
ncbi:hypothetical protein PI124_g1143 [Phytophthora idaei]|nr:hypothetical protein PI125_g433 [Phytophthora idaei]KAG3165926.1 hypothetical protein PI126_g4434 [Phytophthora idaei]KAG3254337.1 hypothetical protein PI124_g1143 [Phytophthora idaei]